MTDCNEDLLMTARANVADRHTPGHRADIMAGLWDPVSNPDGTIKHGTLVQAEIARLLREPLKVEGEAE